jgi:predicted nucleic acid-binding protein
MIVLDTNVVSETMKPQPSAAVTSWMDRQTVETLYLTTPTAAELLFGVAAMPSGPRREKLAENLDAQLAMYEGRILAFDADAARQYARLAAMARKLGRGLPLPDGYIAAIAAAHGFAVATRDAAPFRAVGLRIIDPWSA